ncbi:uncharacterized protein M437DRAFT_69119 [Aureobasidium melanogenum CBS 110374]|uniref:F-box domain-containing protein n=1 Tax=Aureobasidium melanogenum (strain CBS 110374) TaxID=1043003 RepID=A0A074WA89_AURM1|nr:uncharacterized protein M437DRAFT_69119 [Aureobasidium melanogenum CBS 110374]KEQ59436.1 hypothetical protein M437DRAFT_69119 [Aureobasidium melanogenum CBS 110374]
MASVTSTGLLDIPPEIRLMIYAQLFRTTSDTLEEREQRLSHPLVAVCRQLRHESRPVLMSGFQLSLSAFAGKRHFNFYHLDISNQLMFRHLVTTKRKVWAYLPGYLHSWFDFCKTGMVDLVPMCGQIHIWSCYRNIGVTITPRKNTIRMSDPDGRTIEGLDDLASDKIGPSVSVTNWLLKRQLHKALINWKLLCSTSPISVDVVNQIAQQLEHIVVRAARCDRVETNIGLYRNHRYFLKAGVPYAELRQMALADLEMIWAHHR